MTPVIDNLWANPEIRRLMIEQPNYKYLLQDEVVPIINQIASRVLDKLY